MPGNRPSRFNAALTLAISLCGALSATSARSQDREYLPPTQRDSDRYRRPSEESPRSIAPPQRDGQARDDRDGGPGYGQPYTAGPSARDRDRAAPRDDIRPYADTDADADHYSSNEILDAGRTFFGDVSEGLAKVVEYAFRKQGRPNGYILGEEAGGAVAIGLKYGEGVLHTKHFGTSKVYWQGPSLGYDFGANGSKTLTLVYNLRDKSQIFERFGGVEGSAYFVGGIGITFQAHENVVLAPIRAGVGLRLGANVGYLKYTPEQTLNPF